MALSPFFGFFQSDGIWSLNKMSTRLIKDCSGWTQKEFQVNGRNWSLRTRFQLMVPLQRLGNTIPKKFSCWKFSGTERFIRKFTFSLIFVHGKKIGGLVRVRSILMQGTFSIASLNHYAPKLVKNNPKVDMVSTCTQKWAILRFFFHKTDFLAKGSISIYMIHVYFSWNLLV